MVAKMLHTIVICFSFYLAISMLSKESYCSHWVILLCFMYIVAQKHLGYNFSVVMQNIHHIANVVFMAGIKNVAGKV